MAVHDRLAVAIAFSLTTLSTIVVALRFYCRYVLVKKLSSPDWMMLFALLATWGSTVVNFYQIKFLQYPDIDPNIPSEVEAWNNVVIGGLLTWWIYRIFYILDLCLIKIAILLFYNYVTSAHKSFHRIVKALMCMVLASSFGITIAAIFSCNPVSDAWDLGVFLGGFAGKYATQCYNPFILWYFSACWNLFTDCVIWILPIPFVLNLQSMDLRRRLELAGIFSIGIVAIAASAVRLWVVTEWAADFNSQGQNMANLIIWGQVEQHAAIIAGSIPFLRPLARIVLGKRRRGQSPPLLMQRQMACPARTPIIPSPSPTFGSSNSPFKVPPSPLSPIAPVHSVPSGLPIGAAI